MTPEQIANMGYHDAKNLVKKLNIKVVNQKEVTLKEALSNHFFAQPDPSSENVPLDDKTNKKTEVKKTEKNEDNFKRIMYAHIQKPISSPWRDILSALKEINFTLYTKAINKGDNGKTRRWIVDIFKNELK
jgi:hypothetical protein